MGASQEMTWCDFDRLAFIATYLTLEQQSVSDENHVPHLDLLRPAQLFEILKTSPASALECRPESAADATSTTVPNTAVCVEHVACIEDHVHFRVLHSNAGELLKSSVRRVALELTFERLEEHFPGLVGEILDDLGSPYADFSLVRERFRQVMGP